jgi:hypothetical protein
MFLVVSAGGGVGILVIVICFAVLNWKVGPPLLSSRPGESS